jgi:hypothetical protein
MKAVMACESGFSAVATDLQKQAGSGGLVQRLMRMAHGPPCAMQSLVQT